MIKGIGVDICDVRKLKTAIQRSKKFLTRVFSEREIQYCKKKKNAVMHLAGRFAAKEAFIKAVSDKTIKLTNIETVNDKSGRPDIKMTKKIKQILKKKNASRINLSISHTDSTAVAVCVIL
ncbi:MAG: holo-ACP synthase [Candidatus Goldbacteria bacterium]|nr:holo-ACP synthase [Candidatus Goldiibacteriota bacterium]